MRPLRRTGQAPLPRGLAVSLFSLLVPTLAAGAQAPPTCAVELRARPIVGDGTLLSDLGAPLRGPRWSLDNLRTAGERSDLEEIRTRGFNALHVYAENAGSDPSEELPPGYLMPELDKLVGWTDELGIYLIVTVGQGLGVGSVDQDEVNRRIAWTVAFWQHYASRYRDCDHVIYEIQNEPSSPGFSSAILRMEGEAYDHIRRVAPETPVLFFSYTKFLRGRNVLNDICGVEYEVCVLRGKPAGTCLSLKPTGPKDPVPAACWHSPEIDWSRAAVAFHGYAGAAKTQKTLEFVTDSNRVPGFPGYPVIETELSTATPVDDLEPALLDAYESSRTSWLSFLKITAPEAKLESVIDQEQILWAADYGTWPGFSSPPFGSTVTLRSRLNEKLVRVDHGAGWPPPLVADGLGSAADQRFKVVAAGRGHVALLAPASGLFVELRGSEVVVSGTIPYAFEWIDRPDGSVSLLATGIWRHVSADEAVSGPDPPLLADKIRGVQPVTVFDVGPPCGGLFQEAEDGVLRGPFERRSEGGVTFIEVPDGAVGGPQAPDETRKASFCVQVAAAGVYRIKARVRAPSHAADSFWVRVDGLPSSPYLWVPRPLGNWTSDHVAVWGGADPLEVHLSAGDHILDFLLREDGTQLDSISLERQ